MSTHAGPHATGFVPRSRRTSKEVSTSVRGDRLRSAARPRLHLRRARAPARSVAVGKRVLAPSAAATSDRRLLRRPQRDAAGRAQVKAILHVLDDEALLTEHLLRLTRWMADYYLCGWGQVLNAVVPGRRQASRPGRSSIAVPRAGARRRCWPNPLPHADRRSRRPSSTVCCRPQRAGRAAAAARSRRSAARRRSRRSSTRALRGARPGACDDRPARIQAGDVRRRPDTLDARRPPGADGGSAPASGRPGAGAPGGGFQPVPAPRRHRQRQDRDLSAGHRGGRSPGQGGAGPGARDQPDAADDPAPSRAAAARSRSCTATWATPSAAATGGASPPARCRSSSAPAAPSSRRRATSA